MKFSIIIPVKEINNYIHESILYILKQTYQDFEIIIFPDKGKEKFKDKRIKVLETGNKSAGEKRDLALKYAKGEIIAFIDDDAYPAPNWLKNALKNFDDDDDEIAGVGGPGLTPEKDNKFQKASGNALSSWFVSGEMRYRYKKGKRKEIDDFPGCNLFIRKNIFKKVKGFNSKFWPGEDTRLCLKVIGLGKKIIYDPEVVVYHHRRKNLKSYIKQIFSYSLHRGYFAKNKVKNSFKLGYFIPSLFLFGLIFGPLFSLIHNFFAIFYLLVLIIYFLFLFFISFNARIRGISFFRVIYIIFLTNITYGLGFIIGFTKKNLKT